IKDLHKHPPPGTASEKSLASLGSLSEGRQESQAVAQVEIQTIPSETLQGDASLAPSPQSSVSEITSCARAEALQVVLLLLFKCSFSLKENKVDVNKSPVLGKENRRSPNHREDLATALSLTLCGFSRFQKMGTAGLVSNAMEIQNKMSRRQ
ncbi:hypothetical protein DBR06_SOUSAS5910064, partial [Sousa chinensis]